MTYQESPCIMHMAFLFDEMQETHFRLFGAAHGTQDLGVPGIEEHITPS